MPPLPRRTYRDRRGSMLVQPWRQLGLLTRKPHLASSSGTKRKLAENYKAGPSARRAANVTGSTSAASAATSSLAAASTSCESLPGIETGADPAASSILKSPTDEQEHAPLGPEVATRKLPASARTSFARLWTPRSEPIPLEYESFPIFDGEVARMTARYECEGVNLGPGDKEEVMTALAQQVTMQRSESGKSIEVSSSNADAQGIEIDVTYHHADFARHDSFELPFKGRPLEYLAKGPDFGDNELIVQTKDGLQPKFNKSAAADRASLAPHAKVRSIWSLGTSKAATGPTSSEIVCHSSARTKIHRCSRSRGRARMSRATMMRVMPSSNPPSRAALGSARIGECNRI